MHFALANPCENMICKTVRKVYLLLAPLPRAPPPQAQSTRSISVVTLNVLKLFVITIPNPIVSVVFLSFVCPTGTGKSSLSGVDFGKGQMELNIIGQ